VKIKIIALLVGLLCAQVPGAVKPTLRIYLPRDTQVDTDTLELSSIALIRSSDAALQRKASAVAMGRAPFTKEPLVIDRKTILSRLVASGIPLKVVQLTGAQQITVRRNETVIKARDLLVTAEEFLRIHVPGPPGIKWELMSKLADLVVPAASGEFELRSRLTEDSQGNRVKIEVAIVSEEKQLAIQNLIFKLLYPQLQAVTIKDISAGERITPENTKIETVATDAGSRKKFVSPFGKITSIEIKVGNVIRPEILQDHPAAIIIKRDQTVVMQISGAGFTVSGLAMAMEDGRSGDIIKLRNIDTKLNVLGRVRSDGTVNPITKR
jgi:flagella basal body P-ring formation protein FlgA